MSSTTTTIPKICFINSNPTQSTVPTKFKMMKPEVNTQNKQLKYTNDTNTHHITPSPSNSPVSASSQELQNSSTNSSTCLNQSTDSANSNHEDEVS